jgi:hypothetical protein
MIDAREAGGEAGQALEISGEETDALDPLEPAQPGRVANESIDFDAGLFEERLDEMAPEEARPSGHQDPHGPDCMRFGRRGQ